MSVTDKSAATFQIPVVAVAGMVSASVVVVEQLFLVSPLVLNKKWPPWFACSMHNVLIASSLRLSSSCCITTIWGGMAFMR